MNFPSIDLKSAGIGAVALGGIVAVGYGSYKAGSWVYNKFFNNDVVTEAILAPVEATTVASEEVVEPVTPKKTPKTKTAAVTAEVEGE